jgi:hypothetical protein
VEDITMTASIPQPLRPVLALVATLGLALAAPPAQACSICRCGDPTFNALAKDGFARSGFRAALDSDRFDKQEGDPTAEVESQVEQRTTLLLSYGFEERVTVFARVPWSVRNLTASVADAAPEKIHTSGLSDPELYAQVRVWGSNMAPGLGRRASLSLTAGVKAPWGRNNLRQEGLRLDEHAQPGTGSTDLFGSVGVLYLLDPRSSFFASTGYRRNGANGEGYRYGSTLTANVAYEHKLGHAVDGVLELNFRQAQRDRVDADGTLAEDTGGALLYVTPRLLVHLGHGVVLRVAGQIPTARSLNGHQKERAVLNAGLTYLLAR